MNMTSQNSDDIDAKYSILNDVFLDFVDVHQRASNFNVYGPVLFVFSLDVINSIKSGEWWVSKSNPTKRDGPRGNSTIAFIRETLTKCLY